VKGPKSQDVEKRGPRTKRTREGGNRESRKLPEGQKTNRKVSAPKGKGIRNWVERKKERQWEGGKKKLGKTQQESGPERLRIDWTVPLVRDAGALWSDLV